MIADEQDLATMLASGGDDRLALDASGRNAYGHAPQPSRHDLAFSSSTASTISPRGHAAASALWEQLKPEIMTGNACGIYAREAEKIRQHLKAAIGLGPDAADVILAASGTDLHLIVASLLAGHHGRPVMTFALTGSETGSGIAFASAGQHPMPHPVSGRAVGKGAPIAATDVLFSQAVSVRRPGGDLRAEADIAAELEASLAAAIAAGRHCVLVATDVSKTGLIAPGLATVFALKQRFGDHLDILVDACQFRIAPPTLRAYLDRGCLVAVTGSKFLAGPIFSGALVVPQTIGRDLKVAIPAIGLGDYSGEGDWPVDWAARRTLPKRRNFGLLLRWQAALAEMDALFVHHSMKIGWVMLKFGAAVTEFLGSDPRFALIPTRRLDRSALSTEESYDVLPSVHPFLLRRGDQWVPASEMARIYRDLQGPSGGRPAIRLGQPVALGLCDGVELAALRLCLGAPTVAQAAASETALDRLVADGIAALQAAADCLEARASRVA